MTTNGRAVEVGRTDYHYLNRFGSEVIKTRIEYADGHKRFEWPKGSKAEDMLLYNADLLADPRFADDEVIIPEGEKTSDVLVAAGRCSVSFCGGASQRRFGEAARSLIGRRVAIWPDSDKPGLDFAYALYAELREIGVTEVRVIEPVWGGEKGTDAADLLEGLDPIEARNLVSSWMQHTLTIEVDKPATSVDEEVTSIPTLSLRVAFNTPTTPVEYVIEGLLNKGGTSCLSGPFKGGKSTLLRIMCTNIALGRPFMGRDTNPCNVGYLSLEEPENGVKDHFRVLHDYLDPAEAEVMVDHIFYHAGDTWLPPKPEEKIDLVWEYIDRNNLGLLVLGPIQDFFNFRNINDYSEVKPLIRAFTNKVARSTGCHVCFDHHNSKMGQGRNAFLGTVAIGGGVDQLLTLTTVEDSKGEVIGRGINTWQRYGESILSLMGLTYVPNRLGVTIGPPPETMQEQAGLQTLAIRITAFCQAWTDVKVMEEEVRGRRETRLDALAWAIDQGMLVRRPRKGRGGGYEYKDRAKAEADGDDPGTSSGTSSEE